MFTVILITAFPTLAATIPLLLLGPRLPRIFLELAIEWQLTCRDYTPELFMRAAVCLLGIDPGHIRILVAIKWVTSSTSLLATPEFFFV